MTSPTISSRMLVHDSIDAEALVAALSKRYPSLHLDSVPGSSSSFVIRGTFPVECEGHELDRFQIEVDLTPATRRELPTIREVAARIPWTADRHVFANGSSCVCLPEDYFARHPGAIDVIGFLDGPVRTYFIGQALVERGQAWPHGEWSHNSAGLDEWFATFVRDTSFDQFRGYLLLLVKDDMSGDEPCPCGSGKTLSACHYALTLRLRGVDHLHDPGELLDMGARNLRRWMRRWAAKAPR